MSVAHTAILKANEGELKALANLDDSTFLRLLPLLEVGPLTDAVRGRRYMLANQAPNLTYLDRKLGRVGPVLVGRTTMVDGFQWAPDARVESGSHVIAYMISKLRSLGISVIPVVGYDRWESTEYRQGLKSVPPRDDGRFCIRFDTTAIDDVAEPEHFQTVVQDIIEELALDPTSCLALLDFADIFGANMPLEHLVSKATDMICQLEKWNFHHYAVAGCSLPGTINLAVAKPDSVGFVLRKEMLLWQALRTAFPLLRIGSGDYGVRGPTTSEAPSLYTNGKIRHTSDKQMLVVRGHPFRTDGGRFTQLHGLAAQVVASPHYLGEAFSWGDSQIMRCSQREILGAAGDWIAIDTNHHLTFVIQEAEQFEQAIVAKALSFT